ncbi:MAG: BrnA antitoxin family protein [Burkholderiales bacterium]|nr:BrnA antitoxin family protein [Burkholderiales bacterium]
MPTAKKPTTTSVRFSKAEVAAAKAAAAVRSSGRSNVEWSKGVVTPGSGVAATVTAIRRTRGPNKRPAKEQVAIRLDQDVVGALRASGPGWQTRVNTALKEWLASTPAGRKPRQKSAV